MEVEILLFFKEKNKRLQRTAGTWFAGKAQAICCKFTFYYFI
jgi:hypothetical protein